MSAASVSSLFLETLISTTGVGSPSVLAIPAAALIAVRFFVPLYRGRSEISAYSYLEHRFGPAARSYASVFYLLTQIARMGSVMYLMALPLHALLGWSVSSIVLVTGISVIVYAMLGGIEAVIWTDAIQGFVRTSTSRRSLGRR